MLKGKERFWGCDYKRVLPEGLTEQMIQANPELERHVCECPIPFKGSGLTKKKSGGIYNTAEYWEVCTTDKSKKFSLSKLLLALEKRYIYNQIDSTQLYSTHLCHYHLCTKLEHLALELVKENRIRYSGAGCGGWILFIDPELRTMSYVCTCDHKPLCEHLRVVNTRDNPVKNLNLPAIYQIADLFK